MQFDNVSIIKKANVYFDGKVTSRSVLFPDGTKKTLGIMMPGEYTFDTDAAEKMEILGGQMDVKLPGEKTFQPFSEGQTFSVPANASFDLKVNEVTDYCCAYLT